LFRNITELHPFIDGNKRTGLILIETLLRDNNLYLDLTNYEKEKLVLSIAKENILIYINYLIF
jgi:prophage maintenance system killer protein